MRYARFDGQQRISIAQRTRPTPAAGEVVVRVTACCLCGSELRGWRNGWPVTPAHEIGGVIEQPGQALPGQRIVAYIPLWRGTCAACANGDTHLCERATELVGWQCDGGYAEFVVIPEQCALSAIRRKDFVVARSFHFPLHEYAANIEPLRADRDNYMQVVDARVPLDGWHDRFAAFAAGDRLKPQCTPSFGLAAGA